MTTATPRRLSKTPSCARSATVRPRRPACTGGSTGLPSSSRARFGPDRRIRLPSENMAPIRPTSRRSRLFRPTRSSLRRRRTKSSPWPPPSLATCRAMASCRLSRRRPSRRRVSAWSPTSRVSRSRRHRRRATAPRASRVERSPSWSRSRSRSASRPSASRCRFRRRICTRSPTNPARRSHRRAGVSSSSRSRC